MSAHTSDYAKNSVDFYSHQEVFNTDRILRKMLIAFIGWVMVIVFSDSTEKSKQHRARKYPVILLRDTWAEQ